MNLAKLIWGLIIIFIGLIFLLINYGALSPEIWGSIWKLWPLVLILSGLSIISKSLSSAGQIVLNIIIIITLLASILWVISPQARYGLGKNDSYNQASGTQIIDEQLSDRSESSEIIIKTGAAKLAIGSTDSELASGTIEGNFPVDVDRTFSNGKERVELVTSSNRIGIFSRIKNDWNLSLNNQIPTSLELNTGAIEADLNLEEVNLHKFTIKSGASDYSIKLGDKAETLSGEINIGASSIKISLPKSSGLKIISQSGLSSNNFESQGLSRSSDQYTSDNYESAQKKIELTIKSGASSIEIDRY